ncbi:MAG TPA: hypothetical protein PKH77_27440 [Anaerolineae bacterium]|nr:hypothetical protein [Anaerolineae bacterium]
MTPQPHQLSACAEADEVGAALLIAAGHVYTAETRPTKRPQGFIILVRPRLPGRFCG